MRLLIFFILCSFFVNSQVDNQLYLKALEEQYHENYRVADSLWTKLIEGDNKKGIRDFQKFHYRGISRMYTEKLAKGKADFDTSIILNPDYADSYYGRAEAYFYYDSLALAKTDIDKAIALKNTNLEFYILKDIILFKNKEFNEMISTSVVALNIQKDPRFYGFLSIGYVCIGGTTISEAYIKKGKILFGDDAHLLEAEIYYLYKMGDKSYCDVYKKLKKMEPNWTFFMEDKDFDNAIKKCR